MSSTIIKMLKDKKYKLEEELYYNYGKIPYEEYLAKQKEINELKHQIAIQGVREYSVDAFMDDKRSGKMRQDI